MAATIIQIAEDALEKMSPAEIEEYLQGAGKPAGLAFTVDGPNVTWDESGVSAVVETVPVAVEVAPVADVPDFAKMTKEQIEIHVRDNYGVELDRRLPKAKLVAQANTAANG